MNIGKDIKHGTIHRDVVFPRKRISIWSESNKEELKRWAMTGSNISQGAIMYVPGGEGTHGVGHLLDKFLSEKFNRSFDDYDRAIDAVFNASLGGSSMFHHLQDGQHSILGALKAVEGVSPNDSFLRELWEAIEHLLRDLCSVSGINPTFSIKKDTFDAIASYLAPLGIDKFYLNDALTINTSELLGATICIPIMLLRRNSLDNEMTAELTGSILIAAFAGGNPLLLPVAGYALYKCYKSGELTRTQLLYSLSKGALITGAMFSISGAIGGPVWIGLAAGLAVAIAVQYGLGKVEKIWEQVWPAYRGFGDRFPLVIRQIDIPVHIREACAEFARYPYDESRQGFLDEIS